MGVLMPIVDQSFATMQFTNDGQAPIMNVMSRTVPCVLMRAGTSRGPFFLREWLPSGRGRARRGADRRHWRVRSAAARRRGRRQHVDQQGRDRLEVERARLRRRLPVRAGRRRTDGRWTRGPTAATCSPASVRSRSSRVWSPRPTATTTVRVFNVNTRSRIDVTVQTPGGRVTYAGDTRIDGVGRHGGADPAELPRRLGRGHRFGVPDRAAHRRDRRHRSSPASTRPCR